ncbi:hypothetical protein AMJ39_01075 [candidate division TA06 bacterium DG_24]|jgi:putative ABC transport system substrate-binding protein|uniref:ABC transporter substrate-binding protein n=3 Tax=Bacteria division TA06 TaxID=1156500 RepID=A0A0S8JMZ1_UNCT6|nr:MAG: hypothetical protein AMJ39_01075 [candidate division TA06 bacterium DG_24]KPK71658.1 MAG: hypothetical protein AMJ82_00090 [candidate division TA06 bacterium SM23_40]KPL10157.1 MAG: hypothetical protein AMJ71_04185 [candidate division TA06 bacterium SM1_40]
MIRHPSGAVERYQFYRVDGQRVIMVLVAAAIALSGSMMVSGAADRDASIVVVIKSGALGPYENALRGLRRQIEEKSNDLPLWVVDYELRGDVEEGRRMMAGVLEKSPSVIVTLGSVATEAAIASSSEVPIVFSVVLNPVASGLVEHLGPTGRNITGVAMDIPIEDQFEAIRSVCGGKVRRIGVLYNETETGQVVGEAERVAGNMGMELVAERIVKSTDIPAAMERITRDADVLWMVADGRVYTEASTRYVIVETLKWRLPLFAISRPYVDAGALMALACDYEGLGRQAGTLVIHILEGRPPGEIPIERPEIVQHVINLRTAEAIGIDIPEEVLEKAQQVSP